MYLLTYQVRICVFWYLVGTRLTFIVKIIFNLYIIFFLAINCPSQVGEIVGIVLRRTGIVVLASCPCWNTGEIFEKKKYMLLSWYLLWFTWGFSAMTRSLQMLVCTINYQQLNCTKSNRKTYYYQVTHFFCTIYFLLLFFKVRGKKGELDGLGDHFPDCCCGCSQIPTYHINIVINEWCILNYIK